MKLGDTIRKEGYSVRGKPAKVQKLLARGEHISVEGILCCKIIRGNVNGEAFIENQLMLILVPFNGYNPRSVVIMDNCSKHHVNHVMAQLQEIGVLIQWLPPYSLDLNPWKRHFQRSSQK